MDTPFEPLKHLLPKAIAISRTFGRVISCAVTLDTEDEVPGSFRMPYGNVDEIAGDPNLRNRLEPRPLKGFCHGNFELAVRRSAGNHVTVEQTLFRKPEISFQRPNTPARPFVRANVAGIHAGEDACLIFRASKQHVQSSVPPRVIDRAEP